MECNSCDIVICLHCWADLYEAFRGHEHKAITYYQYPDYDGLWQYESECTSCALGSTVTHCSRCYEGMEDPTRSTSIIDLYAEYSTLE